MKIHLVGGFLGSGKTTAISQACKILIEKGIAAAVITNDQGNYLVDSEFFQSLDVPYGQVTGGCFCCNFKELESEINRLLSSEHVSVIFAESVGSCTDLVATVLKPLMKDQGIAMQLTFSTLADARLLLNYLTCGELPFEEDINYIWKKQIEESEILIVNKVDLLSAEDVSILSSYIAENFPEKTLLFQNSLDSESIGKWLEILEGSRASGARQSLDIDYDKYAAGEASLAWLDESIDFSTSNTSALEIAREFIMAFADSISSRKIPVGHLKFIMRSKGKSYKFSYTTTADPIDPGIYFAEPSDHVLLIVNARIQTSPDMLRRLVAQLLTHFRLRFNVNITEHHVSFFSPGYPRPTHRLP